MKVTSIVLAGGKNRRLGRNKALEAFDGKLLIERVIERLSLISNHILVVTSREKADLPVAGKAEILVDAYPDKGPLGGLYTGLLAAQSWQSIVVACDMPFLNIGLLSYMVELSLDVDAVVPRLGEGLVEPLHAVYAKTCLSSMKKRLEVNQLGIHNFLTTIRVKYIERAECLRLDPHLLSFFNINSQQDLDKANKLASEG
ncbi:MAG: molybdenum cofactor guanylyltransferase [Chloroflexi bacterium]|nr:molybdenum cofactor guanylyltransferase [Chloroflexota bacterium]